MPGTRPLKVLIAGAGIAGPALAFWLKRLGHSITIVERWETLRVGGQQIDLRQQGVEAAKRMGILDEIRKHVVDEAGLDIVNEKDQSIMFFPRNEAGSKNQGFTSEFEIMRGDLCRILHSKTRENATYRFGLSVHEFENVGDVVKVTFSDNTVEEYDLLVGADGQGSRIRRALYKNEGGDEQYLRPVGSCNCYFPIKRTAEDEGHATSYLETEQRFVIMRWHKPDLGQVYFVKKITDQTGGKIRDALKSDVTVQKAAFADVFKSLRWNKIGRILNALETADDFYAHENIQVRINKWSKGRVVLLGDAAYCPSSRSGMGTSAALVGAYVLAGEMAKCGGSIETALGNYDTTLRPFIDKIQVINNKLNWIIPSSMVGLKIMNFALKLADSLNVQKLLQGRPMEGGGDWDMPQYEELHEGNNSST